MRTLIFFLFLALFSHSVAWHSFTDDQIMTLLPRICPAKNLLCPLPQYSNDPSSHEWEREKVLSSNAIQEFRAGTIKREETVAFFKKEFCCSSGKCLEHCGISKKEEISLVRGFPGNVKQIFELKIDGLEKFRKDVEEYASHLATSRHNRGRFPGEIEDYFDFLAKNEDRILSMLGKKKN